MSDEQRERLEKGIELLRKLHDDLIDLEIQLQMELDGNPADSGFSEAREDAKEHWRTLFSELFPED